jgi:hypothetical protein
MKKHVYLWLSLIILATGACRNESEDVIPQPDPTPAPAPDPDPEPPALTEEWYSLGLSDQRILKIHPSDQYLYAATENGIYRKAFADTDTVWEARGLENQRVLDFIVFSDNELIACVDVLWVYEESVPSIYRSIDGGASWIPYQNGFGGDSGFNTCFALRSDPSNPDILYGRASLAVARSADRGQSWQLLYGEWEDYGLQTPLLEIHPQYPDIIWAGGQGSAYEPYLFKSADGGQNWTNTLPSEEYGENTAYALITHPTDTNQVMVGIEGQILLTDDGGRSWFSAWQSDNYPHILAMRNGPEGTWVYATGALYGSAGGELFIYRSDDFGTSWETFTHEEGPRELTTNDLYIRNDGPHAGLYFGTTQGIYHYSGF